jgi:hypothetical protein
MAPEPPPRAERPAPRPDRPMRAESEPPAAVAAPARAPAASAPPADGLPADGPLADSVLVARWREIVERVKEKKLLLGTCLEEGLFLGVAGGMVRVALAPEHSFHRAMLEMKENREILNQEFERTYGRGATLHCVGSGEAVTGGIRVARPAEPEPEQARPDPDRDAPSATGGLVQRIVELFDGEVLGPGTQGSGVT